MLPNRDYYDLLNPKYTTKASFLDQASVNSYFLSNDRLDHQYSPNEVCIGVDLLLFIQRIFVLSLLAIF